ncbi:glycosyltransferase [Vibrio profundum]|uniref:glycosyltransferase family 2 protein n=1 Tax=Vibrio profundum TaxID=2910247 RepID=UPI003D10E56E
MNNSLVTVGITAFNSEKTIEGCIVSALSQSWKPLEVIIVDDFSNDETLAEIERVSKGLPNVRIFRNRKNLGVANARNRILTEANGEFIVFFDDDDVSLPNRIFEQYKRTTDYEKQFADGAPVICHTARTVVYPDGEERLEQTMGQVKGRQAPFGPAVARRVLLGEPLRDGYGSCPTCSQMGRLSTYNLIGGFDPSMRRSEDTDFNIRLALAGGHFVGIGEPLVVQTMTNTSDKSLSDEYFYGHMIMKKHRSVMGSEVQYKFAIKWLELKHRWLERKRFIFGLILLKLVLNHPALTLRRLYCALPNIGLNNAFSRFHFRKID